VLTGPVVSADTLIVYDVPGVNPVNSSIADICKYGNVPGTAATIVFVWITAPKCTGVEFAALYKSISHEIFAIAEVMVLLINSAIENAIRLVDPAGIVTAWENIWTFDPDKYINSFDTFVTAALLVITALEVVL